MFFSSNSSQVLLPLLLTQFHIRLLILSLKIKGKKKERKKLTRTKIETDKKMPSKTCNIQVSWGPSIGRRKGTWGPTADEEAVFNG